MKKINIYGNNDSKNEGNYSKDGNRGGNWYMSYDIHQLIKTNIIKYKKI